MFNLTNQEKNSIEECYNFLNNIQISGYNNILSMANALARLQYIVETLQKQEQESKENKSIEIDNTK